MISGFTFVTMSIIDGDLSGFIKYVIVFISVCMLSFIQLKIILNRLIKFKIKEIF